MWDFSEEQQDCRLVLVLISGVVLELVVMFDFILGLGDFGNFGVLVMDVGKKINGKIIQLKLLGKEVLLQLSFIGCC